jgi:hypothetical protein
MCLDIWSNEKMQITTRTPWIRSFFFTARNLNNFTPRVQIEVKFFQGKYFTKKSLGAHEDATCQHDQESLDTCGGVAISMFSLLL